MTQSSTTLSAYRSTSAARRWLLGRGLVAGWRREIVDEQQCGEPLGVAQHRLEAVWMETHETLSSRARTWFRGKRWPRQARPR